MSYSINNFFSDVNKRWLSKQIIPKNNISISYFDLIEEQIESDLDKIIKNERTQKSNFSNFINSFYTGRSNDMDMLSAFVESTCNFTTYEGLFKSIGILNLYDLNSPILIDVIPDCKDSKRYVINIFEPSTGIQKQEYEDSKAEIYKNYKLYLQKFGKIINFPEISNEFLNTEIEISEFYPDPLKDTNLDTLYNPMTYTNLTSQFKNINFSIILDSLQIPKEIQKTTMYIINNIQYLNALNKFFYSKSLNFWRIWIKACVYTSLHDILPQDIRKPYFDFYEHYLKGQKVQHNLDKQILEICSEIATDNLGQLYVESNLEKFKKIKKDATELIHMIKKIANKRIMKLTWLSESSRLIACNKLDKMTLKIAYPEVWFDSFKGVKMDKDQFLLNMLILMKNQTQYTINKLYTLKKETHWEAPCFDVNAFYYSEMNEFCIPLGFLFPPFFGENMSFVQVIAGLGNVVGHEISHGFDKDGRKFDEHGNNYPWWTSLDLELYKKKTQQIINLFNNQSFNGLQVNGELLLDENLADFGAVAICLDMLHNEWSKNPISDNERKKQLREFFIWYSKTWAYKTTRAHEKMAIKTNVHAPAELRVNAILPHFDEFYEAFGFDEKSIGFIKKEDRIDVWGK